jgi:hypothetical protein
LRSRRRGPNRPGTLGRPLVRARDNRQRAGQQQRGAGPLDDARRNQHRRRRRKPGPERPDPEHGEAGQHDALVAAAVAEVAARSISAASAIP